MAPPRHQSDQNPLFLLIIQREEHESRLCRSVSRIWDTPEFLIKKDVRSAIDCLVQHSLQGQKIRPDTMIIDLESCRLNAGALFKTIRSISGLRYTPILALVDKESAEMRDMIYDAGADLVVVWDNLESRIGDIAGLAVDNWLNTDPAEAEELQTG